MVDRLVGRPDAAGCIQCLREAALLGDVGKALGDAISALETS